MIEILSISGTRFGTFYSRLSHIFSVQFFFEKIPGNQKNNGLQKYENGYPYMYLLLIHVIDSLDVYIEYWRWKSNLPLFAGQLRSSLAQPEKSQSSTANLGYVQVKSGKHRRMCVWRHTRSGLRCIKRSTVQD